MNLAQWTEIQFVYYLLVYARVFGLLQAAPVFQNKSISGFLRSGLALCLSLVVFPVVSRTLNLRVNQIGDFLLLVAQELLTGLATGYILNLAFAGIQLAGAFVEVPMGLGMVNIIDPQYGGQVPIIGQLYQLMALWLFLLVNGHLLLFEFLLRSFKILPLGETISITSGIELVIKAFGGIFGLALQVAVVIMGIIFLTDVGLGVLARLIPQINVFIVGFPIKIFLGLVLLIMTLPVFVRWLGQFFSSVGNYWPEALRIISGLRGP